MTTPIPGFEPANPVETPDYYCLQIQGTAQSESVALALQEAKRKRLIECGYPEPQEDETGQMYWRIKATFPGPPPRGGDRFAFPGDFIVVGYDNSGELVHFEFCNGAADSGNVENRLFGQHFTTEGGS